MSEEWRPVFGYEGLYEVSNLGRVRSLPRTVRYSPRAGETHGHTRQVEGLVLSATARNQYGHQQVSLVCDGARSQAKVHRLVLLAFLGQPPNGKTLVRHLDGDPANNRVENLAWGDQVQNEADKRRHGRVYEGERNNKAKMKASDIPLVRAVFDSGEVTQRTAAAYFGLHQKSYASIGQRKTWKHVPEQAVDAEALRLVCLHVAGRSA